MESPGTAINYYDWDGDACRVHQHEDGNVTADIYRAGRGIVAVATSDVLWEGVEISETAYKNLVLQEIALNKTRDED